MSELSERLRRKADRNRRANWPHQIDGCESDLEEAADELERLEAIVNPPPGQCEHGAKEGDWCEVCNREYKQAAIENAAEEKARLGR